MPIEVKGVKQTIKAIRKVDPELLKEMNRQIRAVMAPIRDKARGYAPSPQPDNLYAWNENTTGKTITAKNSAFRTFNTEGRLRLFPLYDYDTVKKGIFYAQPAGEKNKNGWRALYYVGNKSAAGAIYETAGRAGNSSRNGYRSNNPEAGAHFVSRMGPLYGSKREERGRMIFRAWAEDEGKAQAAVIKAIENTIAAFNKGNYTKAA
jgi:hypothetical protein